MTTDLRYALRQLLKSPGFSFVAILALALGIGANVALFSVFNSVLLRPLPYTEPERLVRLASTSDAQNLIRVGCSLPRYQHVLEQQQSFTELALTVPNGFTLTGHGDARQVFGQHASANFLNVLGVQPVLGRFFNADEDRRGGAAVVVISHDFWQKEFNGARDVLGRTLHIDGRPCEIIGVLPAAMSAFPFDQFQLWVPRPEDVSYLVPAQIESGGFYFNVYARLRPGLTLAQASENMTLLEKSYRAHLPRNVDAPTRLEVVPLLTDAVGDQGRNYALLFCAVGCVLLIACANVANLLLARYTGRRKEIAVRFALGASRAQIVRQLVAESTLLALLGGLGGLLLAGWGVSSLVTLAGQLIPRATEIAIDPLALIFSLAVAIGTGVATGLLPAWQAAAVDVNETLKDASRGTSVSGNRLRSGLLVSEIALSLVLLISAGLLLASFMRLNAVEAGFEPRGVFTAQLAPSPEKYSGEKLVVFYRELYRKLSTLPGVRSAAVTDRVPLTGNQGTAPVAVAGRPIPPMSERASAGRNLVSPRYFATLGIRVVAGRDFDERDSNTAPHVVIVNETFVKRHFPGEDPLGRTLITGLGQRSSQIVGVVADVRSTNLNTPPEPDYFLPALQRPENFTSLLVRTDGDPAAIAKVVAAAVREIDPDMPLIAPQPLTTLIARGVADRKLVLWLLGGFAALALLLAGIGVYSVMAYHVSQRTGEIGIRMALGASPREVRRMVIGQGLRLAALGIGVGWLASLAAGRLLQQVLFEVRPHDPAIFLGLAAAILLIAFLACWLPARRATKIDPLSTLRAS